jgi:hypothetical protein
VPDGLSTPFGKDAGDSVLTIFSAVLVQSGVKNDATAFRVEESHDADPG